MNNNKFNLFFEKFRDYFFNNLKICIGIGVIVILMTVNISTFSTAISQSSKSIEAKKEYSEETKNVQKRISDIRKETEKLTNQKKEIETSSKKSESNIQNSQKISQQFTSLIEESNQLGEQRIQEIMKEKNKELTKEEIIELINLAEDKQIEEKSIKISFSKDKLEAVARNDQWNFVVVKPEKNDYVFVMRLNLDKRLEQMSVINFKEKKVEIVKDYSDREVGI